jgi:AraC-like DNA-binding protein
VLESDGDERFGAGRVRSHPFLARSCAGIIVLRDRVVYDSRFAAPLAFDEAWVRLIVVVEGWLELRGVTHAAPVAILIGNEEYEVPRRAGPSFRTWGAPARVIEMIVRRDGVAHRVGMEHGPLSLGDPMWRALAACADAFAQGRPARGAWLVLLARLVDERLLTAEALATATIPEPASVVRLWSALEPRFARLALGTQLKELANEIAISIAQAKRDWAALLTAFPYFACNFRDYLLASRLRLAMQALSAPEVSVGEVATKVGYGSLSAMERAFRDADLPTPSRVLEEVAYAYVAGPRDPIF